MMDGDFTKNADGSQRRILILEQDAAILESLGRILDMEGFLTVQASTVQAAKEIAQSQVLDAILVAEQFHDGDGISFIQAVRGMGFSAAVILLRTIGGGTFATRAADAGVTSILAKPFTLNELRAALWQGLDAGSSEIFTVGSTWGKPTRRGKDSSRSILWMGILASLLIAAALVVTLWALGL